MVLEAGSPGAKGRQGWILLGALWENVFPASLLGVQMAVLSLCPRIALQLGVSVS